MYSLVMIFLLVFLRIDISVFRSTLTKVLGLSQINENSLMRKFLPSVAAKFFPQFILLSSRGVFLIYKQYKLTSVYSYLFINFFSVICKVHIVVFFCMTPFNCLDTLFQNL